MKNQITQRAIAAQVELFAQLPAAEVSAKTDADGRFRLLVPISGDYVIVAVASRLVGNQQELYHWVVREDSVKKDEDLYLSNDNLLSSGSTASLLSIKDLM